MDKEAIAECLESLREDIKRVKEAPDSDIALGLRLDHIEAALIVLMVVLLTAPSSP